MSGWTHHSWRGNFYPSGLAARYELAYAAHRLTTVEITSTFYAIQRPSAFHAWYEATPPTFQFSVQGPRFITHERGLQASTTALANFFASGVLALREKLGPIVWQLPADLHVDQHRCEQFIAQLPTDTHAAADLARHHDLRLRGRTWTVTDQPRPVRYALACQRAGQLDPAAAQVLAQAGVAVVNSHPLVDEIAPSSALHYVRLPGPQRSVASTVPRPRLVREVGEPSGGYDEASLRRIAQWVQRVSSAQPLAQVVVVFATDTNARAPFDAICLANLLGLDQPELPTFVRPRLRLARTQP